MCAACIFGKMLCCSAWQLRAINCKILTPTKPDQVVHVDQMESSTVEFIAKLKGRATKRRYKVATVFTGGATTGYSYVHMQEMSSSADTLKAKLAFKAHSHRFGVTISFIIVTTDILQIKPGRILYKLLGKPPHIVE